LQQDEVEITIEFEADFAQMRNAFESESLEKAKRSGVFRVDPGDHGVFAKSSRTGNDLFQQRGADAAAARVRVDMNSPFDRKTITGPGAEVAEGCKALNLFFVCGDEEGVALIEPSAPTRQPFLDCGGAIVVDCGGVGEDFVVNCGDLFKICFNSVSNLHFSSLHKHRIQRTCSVLSKGSAAHCHHGVEMP